MTEMLESEAKVIVDKVFKDVFGVDNPFSLEEFKAKFAEDIKLPQEVLCMLNGKPAWTITVTPQRYANFEASIKHESLGPEIKPTIAVSTVEDILKVWKQDTYLVADRILNSENVGQSDTIYGSQNVFRSEDVLNSKNIVFCGENISNSEFLVASRRSSACTFSIRADDSGTVSSSFNVIWSKNITKCFYINDCADLFECIMCSHINGKKFCIANMQFDEAEYYRIKAMIVDKLFGATK